jgi:tetratricopeptide (TPR) repeat protein
MLRKCLDGASAAAISHIRFSNCHFGHLSKKLDAFSLEYNQAIRLNPQDANAYYNRGLTYQAQRNIEKAISDFEKAAELYKQQGNQQWYQNSLAQLTVLRGY